MEKKVSEKYNAAQILIEKVKRVWIMYRKVSVISLLKHCMTFQLDEQSVETRLKKLSAEGRVMFMWASNATIG